MKIGGENEDVDRSFADLFLALVFGLIAIFAILVAEFNSFRLAFYVLLTVPLSLVGVFIGLLITDRPISFPSIMGFIALAGVEVNHTIVLIDAFNRLRMEHPERSIHDIVIEGAVSRVRPITLTAVTAAIGAIPLVFVADLWIPLAYALMFGLAFATVLTLVLVPAIYARWPGPAPVGSHEKRAPQNLPTR